MAPCSRIFEHPACIIPKVHNKRRRLPWASRSNGIEASVCPAVGSHQPRDHWPELSCYFHPTPSKQALFDRHWLPSRSQVAIVSQSTAYRMFPLREGCLAALALRLDPRDPTSLRRETACCCYPVARMRLRSFLFETSKKIRNRHEIDLHRIYNGWNDDDGDDLCDRHQSIPKKSRIDTF